MNLISKIGRKRLLIYGGLLLLLLLVCFPFLINNLINMQAVKIKLSSIIEHKTGISIASSKFSLAVFPKPILKIENFTVKLDPPFTMEIDRLQFDFNISQLLNRKISVDKISVDHPHIHESDNEMNQTESPVYSKSLNDVNTQMRKIFSILPQNQKSIDVFFNNVHSPYFDSMDGTLHLSREKKEIFIEYTIHEFRLIIDELTSPDFNKNTGIEQLRIAQIESALKILDSGQANGQSQFDSFQLKGNDNLIFFDSDHFECSFSLSDNVQQIQVLPFDIKTPKAQISIDFKNDILEKTSVLNIAGKNIDVGQTRQSTLHAVKGSKTVSTLFGILLDGMVPSINVSFKSQSMNTLIDEHRLNIDGHIENGKVKIPNTNLVVSKITGAAAVKNGVLDVTVQSGDIQNSEITTGTLMVDLMNYKDHPFNGQFGLNLDLSAIPETLISLLSDGPFTRELALIDTISGKADAQLHLNFTTGSHYPEVVVKAAGVSAVGRYQRIPGDIHIQDLNFGYDSDIITLENCSASLQNSQFKKIQAQIDLTKETPLVHIQSGSGTLDLSKMVPWALTYNKPSTILSPLKMGKGQLHFSDIFISGPILAPEKWEYNIIGAGNNIDLSFDKNQDTIKGLSGQYQLSNEKILLDDLNLVLIQIPVIPPLLNQAFASSVSVPLTVNNATIVSNKNNAGIGAAMIFKQGPSIEIKLSGKSFKNLVINTIHLTDSTISNARITTLQQKTHPLFNFSGKLNIASVKKMLEPDSWFDQKINTYTQNQPLIIYSDSNNELIVDTGHINLTPFFSTSESSKIDQVFLPNHIINLNADRLDIKKISLTDIQSRLSLKIGHSYFRLKKADLCGVQTGGYLNVKDNIIFADFPFSAKDKPNVQDLFSCLLDKDAFMDGQYSLSGNLRSSGPANDGINKISGEFNFNAVNGRIFKLTLLSRILSVLNVSSLFKGKIPDIRQQGFSYTKVTIDADIKHSKIYLKNAVIDGTDMTMVYSGWIDPINDQLELTCLVAPFKTVDLVIKYIPIVNTLFGGNLISIPVKASGKLSDPTVIPLHPSVVGKGLVDMMSGVLKTPVKLWDKLYKE